MLTTVARKIKAKHPGGRPRKPEAEKKVPLFFKARPEDIARVKAAAVKEHLEPSALVRQVVLRWLDAKGY